MVKIYSLTIPEEGGGGALYPKNSSQDGGAPLIAEVFPQFWLDFKYIMMGTKLASGRCINAVIGPF